ncbi:MAG: RNA-binding transcriptional accessory protein [Erysipelotrichales bacterium]|nr:RNA-binding transcriptional accessory protein [Erysipelotrichales bacterium]
MKELMKGIAKELSISTSQVEAVLSLLEEGNTVPFIARYRKEMTKGLDEDAIRHIEEGYKYQVNLKTRKEDVIRLIAAQDKLTPQLEQEILACEKLSQVEDIYRPYQQKKKTRAAAAIAAGLEPLADYMVNKKGTESLEKYASTFLNDKITTMKEALQGACDILAERFSDDLKLRNYTRKLFRSGVVYTKIKKNAVDEKKVYQMYYDYNERVSTLANHRVLAIDRAEKEKVISVEITIDQEKLEDYGVRNVIWHARGDSKEYVRSAYADSLKRLLLPSVEREIRNELSQRAQDASILLFSGNVEKLLLQAPLKNKTVLGFDPAFRTGCKLAVIDPTGKLLQIDVIYPNEPHNKKEESKKKILALLDKYPIDIIAIGNGTASRESQNFVASVLKDYKRNVQFTLVSEAGASVYSASVLAKKEFPDLQVEQRSAVSIARRIIDPLAELIKIDPQSIGVGQYQHDLPQAKLSEQLDFVVLKAVNRVGVDVNTASASLLSHVAGLSSAVAKEIVEHRNKEGRFTNRKELLDVKKMGPKSFQQSAGFLRIMDGEEVLDSSSIHPESYAIAYKIMEKLSIQGNELGSESVIEKIKKVDLSVLSKEVECDEYTLKDILDAFTQPKRDYRDQYEAPLLRSDVLEITDLKVGDELEGVVRNVVDFGAFVDIGLHEDGLIHISKLSRSRVSHPSEVVSIGDILKVKVFSIDEQRGKVGLSLL